MEPNSFRQLLDQQAAETRRHFDGVAEGLRADNRLLAESVAGVASRLERLDRELRAEMAKGFTELKSMIEGLSRKKAIFLACRQST
jgi:hypothetical protein